MVGPWPSCLASRSPSVVLALALLVPASLSSGCQATFGQGRRSPAAASPAAAAPGTALAAAAAPGTAPAAAAASPVDPPRCDSPRVAHYNSYFCCEDVEGLHAPSSVEHAVALIKREILHGTGPIRAVGNLHTANPSICSRGLVVRTSRLKKIIGIEHVGGEQTVVAEAGVTIIELNRWLHERGYSLGAGTLEFRDATVAGAVATGAHGSSLMTSSVISSRVRGLWIITPAAVEAAGEAYAGPSEIRMGQVDDQVFRALAANLGMAGLVTQVRLAIDLDYHMRVAAEFAGEEALWTGAGAAGLVGGCDWGQVLWFPRAGRIARFCGVRTDQAAAHGAENRLLDPGVWDIEIALFKQLLRAMAATNGRMCTIEQIRLATLQVSPPQIRKVWGWGETSSSDVVGPAYDMMSSRLTEAQAEIKQNDFEIAIPVARAPEVLRAMKAYAIENNLCLPFVGVFLRFGLADARTLAAHSSASGGGFEAGAGVLFLEFVVYRPAGREATATDDYFGPYWRWAEHLIRAHGGRPHWAKNDLPLFQAALSSNPDYAARLERFREVMARFDPRGRFANDFTLAAGLSRPPSPSPPPPSRPDPASATPSAPPGPPPPRSKPDAPAR